MHSLTYKDIYGHEWVVGRRKYCIARYSTYSPDWAICYKSWDGLHEVKRKESPEIYVAFEMWVSNKFYAGLTINEFMTKMSV